MSNAHDIFALDVSVDHSVAVQVLQSSGDFNGDRVDYAAELTPDGDDVRLLLTLCHCTVLSYVLCPLCLT